MKKILLLICTILTPVIAISQMAGIAVVKIDSVDATAGSEILLPVRFTGWNQPDVAAITLSIHIADTNVIGFRALQDFNPSFSGLDAGNTNYLPSSQTIMVAWSSLTVSQAASGILFNIRLLYKGGYSSVVFDELSGMCEIADLSGAIYTITWCPGQVSDLNGIGHNESVANIKPVVSPNPADALACFSFYNPESSVISIDILNAVGEVVKSITWKETKTGHLKKYIRTEELQNGLYYYRFVSECTSRAFTTSGKLIIRH